MSAPWTEAHQREAEARRCELAAELRRVGKGRQARMLVYYDTLDERDFGARLRDAGFDEGRITRELKRLHALVDGRLVRETSQQWKGVSRNGALICGERPLRSDVVATLAGQSKEPGDHIVKITLRSIRRAR